MSPKGAGVKRSRLKAKERSDGAGAPTDAYRELFEHSADAILIIEGETFVDCNQATVDMLRYGCKEDLLRTHPSELSPPTQPDGRDSFSKANEMISLAFENGSHRFEWNHRRADGEVFPVEVLLTAVQREERRVLHVVWRDVTDRKQLETRLRHAQKMEAIGKLAGGIAHDFNNLLAVIICSGSVLKKRLADRPDDQALVDELVMAGDRAASLVRQLLTFSRRQELRPVVLDVNTLVETVRSLLVRLIGEEVRVDFQLSAEELAVKADPGQLEQVLMNLASNARDAMPHGGNLTIRSSRALLPESIAGEDHEFSKGEYAVLAVEDTGVGMDERTVARAFDPFFTTKDVGRGTGLGLATVHGIVQQSGGKVSVTSAVGVGTTVEIFLPLTEEVAGEREAPEVDLPERGGGESILVVEDDPSVATVVVNALRGNGYRVACVANGKDALAVFLRPHETIDLVLTDVVMPMMGGPEWVSEARKVGHQINVLFMSGYTDDALGKLRASGEDADLLEKPFSSTELVGRVRLALDRGGQLRATDARRVV